MEKSLIIVFGDRFPSRVRGGYRLLLLKHSPIYGVEKLLLSKPLESLDYRKTRVIFRDKAWKAKKGIREIHK